MGSPITPTPMKPIISRPPRSNYTDARDVHPGAPRPPAVVGVALARGARARRELAAGRAGGDGGRVARAGARAARHAGPHGGGGRLGGVGGPPRRGGGGAPLLAGPRPPPPPTAV